MLKTKLHELADLGQSIWLDYINRELIDSGKLQEWVDNGLKGMTSNPSIFNQVISQAKDYDDKISQLKNDGKSIFEIYDELTVADIGAAADIFGPVYQESKGLDGYVSLEINPELAHDAKASIKEGKRLFAKVGRPNVMIKVPATDAGFPVIEELLASGINVNVTLIFSMDQYRKTVEAYLKGLERLAAAKKDLSKIRSVASVFVSRIDTAADKQLEKTPQLKGKAAVANSRLIFGEFQKLFAQERFKALAHKGASVQRVLWGSTSTKNPDYEDVKYVTELIADPTVNTVPEPTLRAFMDHGKAKIAFRDAGDAAAVIGALREAGIDVDQVCAKLLEEGVAAFDKAFKDLMKAIAAKAEQLCAK